MTTTLSRRPATDEALDVRLHAPTPDAVIVRVSGSLCGTASRLLGLRIYQQLRRAPHVVVDLTDVTDLGAAAVGELLAADAYARAWGARLHIAGVGRTAAAELQPTGLDRLTCSGPAAAVLAQLRSRALPRRRSDPARRCAGRPRPTTGRALR